MAAASHRYLWLLRHAKTLSDPPPGGADRERRLAGRGERDAAALGERLSAGRLNGAWSDGLPAPSPEVILSSTAARARQTAELVCGPLDPAPRLILLDSLYAATPAEILRQVGQQADPDLHSAMVVGHNPTVRALAVELINEGDRRDRRQMGRRSFDTCGLAVYDLGTRPWSDLSVGTGRLLAFVIPPY